MASATAIAMIASAALGAGDMLFGSKGKGSPMENANMTPEQTRLNQFLSTYLGDKIAGPHMYAPMNQMQNNAYNMANDYYFKGQGGGPPSPQQSNMYIQPGSLQRKGDPRAGNMTYPSTRATGTPGTSIQKSQLRRPRGTWGGY